MAFTSATFKIDGTDYTIVDELEAAKLAAQLALKQSIDALRLKL